MDDLISVDELTDDEFRRVIGLSPADRLRYLVAQCKETGRVWSIGSGGELVVYSGEDAKPFVFAFPHPEFWEDWLDSIELDEDQLVSVKTADWVELILPGLEEAGIQVRVFPTSEDEGLLMPASQVAELFGSDQGPTEYLTPRQTIL